MLFLKSKDKLKKMNFKNITLDKHLQVTNVNDISYKSYDHPRYKTFHRTNFFYTCDKRNILCDNSYYRKQQTFDLYQLMVYDICHNAWRETEHNNLRHNYSPRVGR